MSDVVLTGLISGIVGVIAVAIPALIAIRKQPTKRTTDAITLVDASGQVIGNLTDEIARLERELQKTRKEMATAMRRLVKLEAALMGLGVDPQTINGKELP